MRQFQVPVNQLLLLSENLAVPTTCQLENGGCEHFCNEDTEGQRLNCSCADGYFLGEDGQSCMAIGIAILEHVKDKQNIHNYLNVITNSDKKLKKL